MKLPPKTTPPPIPPSDGGPAFPLHVAYAGVSLDGMSLREWFAGQAISAILSNVTLTNAATSKGTLNADPLVAFAYLIADGMLKQRKK